MRENWRWTQWTLLLFIAVAYIAVLCSRETYKKVILKKRAEKQEIVVPASGPTGENIFQ
jgi:hypothetical protein